MLTPIELIKATVDGMIERGFGRIVNITSGAVKAPIDVLGLSNGARSGLTGFVAGLARQSSWPRHNVTINNLLPGVVRHRPRAQHVDRQPRPSAARRWTRCWRSAAPPIPAGASAPPTSSAPLCAFLCSAQAGYLTGQNILLDGGAYPGTF